MKTNRMMKKHTIKKTKKIKKVMRTTTKKGIMKGNNMMRIKTTTMMITMITIERCSVMELSSDSSGINQLLI